MHDGKGVVQDRLARISKGSSNGSGHADGASPMQITPQFCPPGMDPFDTVEWDKRTAHIKDENGGILFEQTDCEVPKTWSALATNVVVSKYFYGEPGTPERESSVRQVIFRVARTIADWGIGDGYFETREDGENFYRDLAWMCLHQYGSFNSPVWFNVGLYHQYGIKGSRGNYHWDPKTGAIHRPTTPYEYPQASACFIQSVDDNMEDIMRLATSEAMLFKYGSGTGTDLSTLRSAREKLSGGGIPSGPLSFMRVYDQIAAVVKSGGKTRRAAKMQSLKDWHPDILEFIQAKAKEEKKARTLIESGEYDANFNGEAYSSIMFQNANLSVRVSDDFMQSAVDGRKWRTHWVTDPKVAGPEHEGKYLLRQIAEGTWYCGDPGLQFETTINRWHTCPATGPINASNPCSEYMFLDDTACNLSSLNLKRFQEPDGRFNVERFRQAATIFITAQEILVDHASYPTPAIAENSHVYRPLGLGYANLGSLLMSMAIPYDSDEGRGIAGALTALLNGQAYSTSSRIAANLGPFAGYHDNERSDASRDGDASQRDRRDRRGLPALSPRGGPASLGRMRRERPPLRLSQCPGDGAGSHRHDCLHDGLRHDRHRARYRARQVQATGRRRHDENRQPHRAGSLADVGLQRGRNRSDRRPYRSARHDRGGAGLLDEHLPVFDCAFRPKNGKRSIHWEAHVKMMAAAQPFLSGAISKTVNMPQESTVEEIENAYLEGWRLGLKALAIYRDGSKQSQPLATSKEGDRKKKGSEWHPVRRRLPATRQSLTHKFSVGGHEGYITVGLFEDGSPGELFITMAKEGSTIGGLMDTIGTETSLGLQYGVPLRVFVDKFSHTRFEPSGWTTNQEIPHAKSVVDYIFRWLGIQFIPGYREANTPHRPAENGNADAKAEAKNGASAATVTPAPKTAVPHTNGNGNGKGHPHVETLQDPDSPAIRSQQFASFQTDAPACDNCGAITVRNGNCYLCHNCGNSMGCS